MTVRYLTVTLMVADFLFLSVTVTVVLPALTPLMVILLSLTLAVATFESFTVAV